MDLILNQNVTPSPQGIYTLLWGVKRYREIV